MYNIASINRLFLLGFSLNFSMTALYLLFQQKRIHKRMNISLKDTLYIVSALDQGNILYCSNTPPYYCEYYNFRNTAKLTKLHKPLFRNKNTAFP